MISQETMSMMLDIEKLISKEINSLPSKINGFFSTLKDAANNFHHKSESVIYFDQENGTYGTVHATVYNSTLNVLFAKKVENLKQVFLKNTTSILFSIKSAVSGTPSAFNCWMKNAENITAILDMKSNVKDLALFIEEHSANALNQFQNILNTQKNVISQFCGNNSTCTEDYVVSFKY